MREQEVQRNPRQKAQQNTEEGSIRPSFVTVCLSRPDVDCQREVPQADGYNVQVRDVIPLNGCQLLRDSKVRCEATSGSIRATMTDSCEVWSKDGQPGIEAQVAQDCRNEESGAQGQVGSPGGWQSVQHVAHEVQCMRDSAMQNILRL